MTEASARRRLPLGRLTRWIRTAFLILCAIVALGVLVPALPAIGIFGTALVNPFGAWIMLLSAIGAIIEARRWLQSRRAGSLAMLAIAAIGAIGVGIAQAQQMSVARLNGVHVDLGRTLWLGPVSHKSMPPEIVTWGKFEGEELHAAVYRPFNSSVGARAPVVVYIHGGGWVAGSYQDRQPDMRWFADRGYLAISLEYSLSSDSRHLWQVVQPQLGCALAWVGSKARSFGGDPSRLGLFGESAGGNLVLNVPYMTSASGFHSSCAVPVPRVSATVALYPVVDPVGFYRNPDVVLGRFGRAMVVDYTGGSPGKFPERYAFIASATYIRGGAPATLLIVPEADHLVPPQATYDFAARARARGVDVRLIRVPYADHGFDVRSGSIGNQLFRQSALHFLTQHGVAP